MAQQPDPFAADSSVGRTTSGGQTGQGGSGANRSTAFQGAQAGSYQRQGAVQSSGSSGSGVTEHAKQAISNTTGQAAQKVVSTLDSQKDKAAEGLGSIAHALRQTGDQLRGESQGFAIDSYIATAADQVERFSGYLRSTNTRDMVRRVEDYARQQPALFFGSALLIGLLGARFLKSSGRDNYSSQYGQGSEPQYGQSGASQYGQSSGSQYGQSGGSQYGQSSASPYGQSGSTSPYGQSSASSGSQSGQSSASQYGQSGGSRSGAEEV
jgi:hypothetical protein